MRKVFVVGKQKGIDPLEFFSPRARFGLGGDGWDAHVGKFVGIRTNFIMKLFPCSTPVHWIFFVIVSTVDGGTQQAPALLLVASVSIVILRLRQDVSLGFHLIQIHVFQLGRPSRSSRSIEPIGFMEEIATTVIRAIIGRVEKIGCQGWRYQTSSCR